MINVKWDGTGWDGMGCTGTHLLSIRWPLSMKPVYVSTRSGLEELSTKNSQVSKWAGPGLKNLKEASMEKRKRESKTDRDGDREAEREREGEKDICFIIY